MGTQAHSTSPADLAAHLDSDAEGGRLDRQECSLTGTPVYSNHSRASVEVTKVLWAAQVRKLHFMERLFLYVISVLASNFAWDHLLLDTLPHGQLCLGLLLWPRLTSSSWPWILSGSIPLPWWVHRYLPFPYLLCLLQVCTAPPNHSSLPAWVPGAEHRTGGERKIKSFHFTIYTDLVKNWVRNKLMKRLLFILTKIYRNL